MQQPDRVKRSVGTLKNTPKTKPRSPDCTGTMRIQRHTFQAISDQFRTGDDTVEANLAGWLNELNGQRVLVVELSPKYVQPPVVQLNPDEHVFDCFANSKDNK